MRSIYFILLALLVMSTVDAVDILYSEPVLNCSKPLSLFRPNPRSSNGIVNLFLGERSFMRLNPQGPNYATLLPLTGSGIFEVFDGTDGQAILETVCSFPYGVAVGQSYYGGILRYPLTEIEQMYGYASGSLRIETTDYNDTNFNGLWEPYEPLILAPAFATVDLNIGNYTTPTNPGPIVSVSISQIPQPGNNVTLTAIATPPIGRGIQGLYLQAMPNGVVTAINTICPPVGICTVNLTLTVNQQPQTFHVHVIDSANVGHAKAFQI